MYQRDIRTQCTKTLTGTNAENGQLALQHETCTKAVSLHFTFQ